MSDYKTVDDIVRELGIARHRVEYAILAHAIKPTSRVGRIRLYDPQAVEQIERALLPKNVQAHAAIG
jgi:hypothetical protein